jgi:single-stranded DNA-binding protein
MEWGSVMDLNLIVLCGRLAVPPEIKVFESGTRLIRYLVTVRSEEPRRRVDVIPVSMWDPPQELIDESPESGRRIWVCGSVDRHLMKFLKHLWVLMYSVLTAMDMK